MNPSRNTTIDVARGFIVFIMPAVHSLMLYSTKSVQTSWLGIIFGFLAEGPGAQLFMVLMGISLTLGRPKTLRKVLIRSLLLLALGYLLNLTKLLIPYSLGMFPPALLQAYGIAPGVRGALQLLTMGDILEFAAPAYLLTWMVYRLPHNRIWAVTGILAVTVVSPLVWDKQSVIIVVQYLLQLIGGQPPRVFFPLFPWLVYPLFGLLLGCCMKQWKTRKLYRNMAFAGILLLVAGKALAHFEPAGWEGNFYRTGPAGTLYHLGIVTLWLCLCRLAVTKIRWNYFYQFLSWLSKHITSVYILQWNVVCWLLPLFGFSRLGLLPSVCAIIITSAVSFGLSRFMDKLSVSYHPLKTISYE
ncbi:MAG: DUF1624 domain-containing protein [Chitinophagaceae bacterium]|nr:MAG: DUF1624 domain-containing protein [Chitinophagaceae bacterium]